MIKIETSTASRKKIIELLESLSIDKNSAILKNGIYTFKIKKEVIDDSPNTLPIINFLLEFYATKMIENDYTIKIVENIVYEDPQPIILEINQEALDIFDRYMKKLKQRGKK